MDKLMAAIVAIGWWSDVLATARGAVRPEAGMNIVHVPRQRGHGTLRKS